MDGSIDSGKVETEESNCVTLELDDMCDITGPKLSPNSTPPYKLDMQVRPISNESPAY